MKDIFNNISITQAKADLKRGLFLDDDIYIIDNLDMSCFPTNKRTTKGFLFILCERGSMQCEIEKRTYRAQRNSIFLLHTNDHIENITFPTNDFCGKAMIIAPEDLNYIVNFDEQIDFLQTLSEIHLFCMKENSVSDFNNLFFGIRNELLKNNKNVRDHTFHLTRIIVDNLRLDMQLLRPHCSQKKKDKYQLIYDNFMLFLQENNYRFRKINSFCKRGNISYITLERAIKKITGIPPHEYQRRILTQEMCIAISKVPHISLTKIAHDFHFQSESAFAHYFQKGTSMSPTNYRKQKHLQQFHPVPDTSPPQT